MIIRQEEESPIGDYYHDNKIEALFNDIKNSVDEFDVESEVLKLNIDALISLLKSFRTHVTLVEKNYTKYIHQKNLRDKYNVDV